MTELHLVDLKVKNIYRKKPSEDEGARARRIHAEQNLKNAWVKAVRDAGKANGAILERTLRQIQKGAPWQGKEPELKLLLGRCEREVDKILAIAKANEFAREMMRIGLATDAAKPKTPSSRGRKKAA